MRELLFLKGSWVPGQVPHLTNQRCGVPGARAMYPWILDAMPGAIGALPYGDCLC